MDGLDDSATSLALVNNGSNGQEDLFAGAWICNTDNMNAIRHILGGDSTFPHGRGIRAQGPEGLMVKGYCQGIRTFGGAFGDASYGRIVWEDGMVDDVLIPEEV